MRPISITSCEEAIRVLAEHLDHELNGRLEAELNAHLESCRSCCSRTEFERELKARIRDLGAEPVDHGVADRVQALLHSFADTPTP
ncbi:MAG TPA: zf-HC2 domain-containing protein [Gemmatimonadales bacterium]|nr:zf-HC2 domain-containing protein [Gemmatimonadales bacterium]